MFRRRLKKLGVKHGGDAISKSQLHMDRSF